MAHDFELEKGTWFGEWLHQEMHEEFQFEDQPWALERVQRVEGRLQAGRSAQERLRATPYRNHVWMA
jgi:hypothetical protein